MNDEQRLAAAYWSLLRAYPAAYRRERGEEIVSVLLEDARPGQRWPTATQALDLIGGGLRRRLGLWRFVAPAGVRVAGGAALALAAGLSLFWLTGYEVHGEPMWEQAEPAFGPFESTSPVMYAAWLATVAALCLFGRYGRRLTLLSLSVTWGMNAIVGYFLWAGPAEDLRTALLLLGLVALAAPARPPAASGWQSGAGRSERRRSPGWAAGGQHTPQGAKLSCTRRRWAQGSPPSQRCW